MGFKCGIIGLPNVGKSTLFNALTASNIAEAANFPFCTIEPNTALVTVPDERIYKLAAIVNSKKILPTYMQFVDIAGIVKGASKGEGLGNQFLSNIRQTDAVIHVLRYFSNKNITHVHNKIDPLYDAEIVEIELILADITSVEKQILNLKKKNKIDNKNSNEQIDLLKIILSALESGIPARKMDIFNEKKSQIKEFYLLTDKPLIYVLNVDEDKINNIDFINSITQYQQNRQEKIIIISAQIEHEISLLSHNEQSEFLNNLGIKEKGLNQLIKVGYNILNLQNFFTVGIKETKSWTIKKGTLAPQAAGVIHTDFEKGFIRAEVIGYEDYIKFQGETKAKELGKMRLEGKDYVIQDGDVIHFRFNI